MIFRRYKAEALTYRAMTHRYARAMDHQSDRIGELTRALAICAKALAFSYGGTDRTAAAKSLEEAALWDAMRVAYSTLGVNYTGDLPPHHRPP